MLDLLKRVPDNSISTVVTSPPYWGLRNYGVKGQLGLESTPEEFVDKLVEVFEEIRRVLKPWGTLWLNLGDSYCNSSQSGGEDPTIGVRNLGGSKQPKMKIPTGLKPKDILGMPWMVAFALRSAGWYLRSDIIWNKTNPMPESVMDRPTKSHEYIFLLSKSKKYFYDMHAIKEPAKDHGDRDRTNWSKRKTPGQLPHSGGESGNYASLGRNKRSVWNIATQSYKKAHFATFPLKLIEPCILAGCPEQVCIKCGKPRERIVDKKLVSTSKAAKKFIVDERDINADKNDQGSNRQKDGRKPGYIYEAKTIGYTDCGCGAEFVPGVVLDPFMGAGTTAVQALSLQRHYLGIELKKEYIELTERRIIKELGLYALI